MTDKKGYLIGGFKAIGKSTLQEKYNNIIDLESSYFEYIIDEELQKIPVEQRKGLKNRKKNPKYPLNYYNELLKLKGEGKIVLFACKKEIITLLKNNNIDYYTVYPKEEMLDEIIERCKKRKNNEEFISRVKTVYYDDYPEDNNNVFWLENGEYLENILLKNNIITKNMKKILNKPYNKDN